MCSGYAFSFGGLRLHQQRLGTLHRWGLTYILPPRDTRSSRKAHTLRSLGLRAKIVRLCFEVRLELHCVVSGSSDRFAGAGIAAGALGLVDLLE